MSDRPCASIDNLDRTWQSIDALCAALTEEEWKLPSGCPGWSVQDNLSHLIDYEARAVGRPGPDHTPADLSHTKNPIGESNEVGVDFRRTRTGQEVLAEFRDVMAARLAQLDSMSEDDLAGETVTPVGPGTVADMLRLRVMDTWSHEQDIRRAVGRAGHIDGPAAVEAVAYLTQFLPLIVGKRAGAPDGTVVAFTIGELHRSVIEVANGRAAFTDRDVNDATVSLSIAPATFAALVGGRSDAPDDAVISGDAALGATIVGHLGFLP